MNLVIDDAVEVKVATKTDEESRRKLGRHIIFDPMELLLATDMLLPGRILLKGDNVSLIQTVHA